MLIGLLPGGVWGGIAFMSLLIFLLGFFLDWIEISYIVLPLFPPYFTRAGVDLGWLCILVAMILQTSFLTPPFGWSLFYLRGVAPPEIRTRDISTGVMPFIGVQLLALAMLCLFAALAVWLPHAIGG